METEGPVITFQLSDELRAAEAIEGLAASPPIEPHPNRQGLSFVAVTLGLAVSACYLAFESWSALTRASSNPASNQVVIVALLIQVFSPFLPPLSYAVIYLSARRDARWYFNYTALCFLGILAAIIEVLAHAPR
jgi:hypothetical protein